MKAALYNEEEQKVDLLDEQQQALADQKPEKADVPKQGLYLVNYKTLVKPTLIALAILVVWVVLLFVL